MENIQVLLKEYDTVKSEIADSLKTRNQILSFGLAIAALIVNSIATILGKDEYKAMGEYLLLFVLPSIAIAILVIWLGELERMIRAGNYMLIMERRINEMMGEDILTWEEYRRTSRIRIWYAYLSVLAVFGTIALLPLMLLFSRDKIPLGYFFYSPSLSLLFVVFLLRRFFKFIRTNDHLEVKLHK